MESRAGKVAGDEAAVMHLSIFVRVCVTERRQSRRFNRAGLLVGGYKGVGCVRPQLWESMRVAFWQCVSLWFSAGNKTRLVRGVY